jgi:hypothetical protein
MTTKRNYYLILDGSASMDRKLPNSQTTRWKSAEEGICALVRKVAADDPDGLDLYLVVMNQVEHFPNQADDVAVSKVFADVEPWGDTPLHLALAKVVDKFASSKSDAVPSFCFVLCDGRPDDDKAIVVEIKRAADFMVAQGLPDEYMTFCFIQVGDDAEGTKYLTFLDQSISSVTGGLDIVKSIPYATIGAKPISKLIEEAIKG